MPCHVPDEFKHLRWHIIKSCHLIHKGQFRGFEIAEWVNSEDNGPTEKGHWVRWGTCGDFPSLSQAEYICPCSDAEHLEGAINATGI